MPEMEDGRLGRGAASVAYHPLPAAAHEYPHQQPRSAFGRMVARLQRQIGRGGPGDDEQLAQFADRGTGWYKSERDRKQRAYLVETGRHAGRSRVKVHEAKSLMYHTWKRDFFTSLLGLPLIQLFGFISLVEIGAWLFWGAVWFMYHRATGRACMVGFDGSSPLRAAVSAFLFAIETQQTIGYGARVPLNCLGSATILSLQCLTQLLLESSCIGVVFARLSHPKNRGRSIFISESAVICRRDGALKLMFRVADVRATQVIQPHISAYLYAFGRGRNTTEGEGIPVRVEPLKLDYKDGMLLLPVTIEHTIDNTSPLYGHSHDTLEEANAEIIVTFEASTETGSTFSARQSYLPGEIHWGCTFVPIIHQAVPPETQHSIAMSRFHEVEPLPGLAMMTPSELSRHVLAHERNAVPFPVLTENTLVLSDDIVICQRGSRTFLVARVGDTCPRSTATVTIRAYLYREDVAQGEVLPFKMYPLDLKHEEGLEGSPGVTNLNVLLRMPQLVLHEITKTSPLVTWMTATGMMQSDANSEVVIQMTGLKANTGLPVVLKRNYMVFHDVFWGHHFKPLVQPPSRTERKPVVDWSSFHAHLAHRPHGELGTSRPPSRKASADSNGDKPPTPPGSQAPHAVQTSIWSAGSGMEEMPMAKLGPSSRFEEKDRPLKEHEPSGSRRDRAVNSKKKSPTKKLDGGKAAYSPPQLSGYLSDESSSSSDSCVAKYPPGLRMLTREATLKGMLTAASSPSDTTKTDVKLAKAEGGSCNLASHSHNSEDRRLQSDERLTTWTMSDPAALQGGDFSAAYHAGSSNEHTSNSAGPGVSHRSTDWATNRSLFNISFDAEDTNEGTQKS